MFLTDATDVRYGSKADLALALQNVCLVPHAFPIAECHERVYRAEQFNRLLTMAWRMPRIRTFGQEGESPPAIIK